MKYRPQTFKVQRPLYPDSEEKVLIYNRARTIEGAIDMTPEILALFPENMYKVYIRGVFDPDTGRIEYHGMDEWQDW